MAVRRIEGVLRDTGGNLGAAAEALVTLDAAWEPASKLRTPQDYVIAALRALDLPDEELATVPLQAILAGLGQPFQNCAAAERLARPSRRLGGARSHDATDRLGLRRVWTRRGTRDVAELAAANLGPLLRDDTLQAVRRAGSRRDAMTLLLSAPEFQRR